MKTDFFDYINNKDFFNKAKIDYYIQLYFFKKS